MRHKNKKSLKNLKQFRVRSKFVFYVVLKPFFEDVKDWYFDKFRPLAQKLFFPIMGLILVVCIINHEYETKWQKDRWTFNHEPIAESYAQPTNDSSVTSPVADTKSQSESGESVTVKTNTRGSITHSPQVEVIKQVAEKEGIDWKVLYGICVKESNCNSDRVGDSGNSYGAFQIHQKYHPGTVECAKDLKCSAEWTAKRLKRFSNLGEWKMIQSHNGLLANNANAYYVEDVLQIIQSL